MGERFFASTNGFRLGLDWSKPAESIDLQSLTQAINCEYSSTDGALQTVPGVRTVYTHTADIESLYYDNYRKQYYFSCGRDLYKTADWVTVTPLGTLTGNSTPKYHAFDHDILIASGGKLQAVSGAGVLSTVDESPTCEFVSSHSGSVMVASIYGHRITWSAVGDYKSWKTNTNDPSSAQYVEVGYKDPGCIVSIDFLSKAIIVYKEYGRAYQVVGNPHEKTLAVYPLSETALCCGSSISIDDRSYYLGDAGLMSFVPTNTYANIQPSEVGLNINAQLTTITSEQARMWHIPSRKQLWIKPGENQDIFIYHYLPRYEDGRGVFTSRSFVHNLHDVLTVGKDVYIAYGNKIGILDMGVDTDDGEQITTSIVSGNRLAQRLFLLLFSYNFVSSNRIEGYGSITISDKRAKPVTFKAAGTKLYYANEKLINATGRLNSNEYTKVNKIGGGANRHLQIKIFVAKGAIALRQFDFNYEEV